MAKPDIREFYKTFYAPNNATILLVGDFDEPTALSLIETHYGAMPSAELRGVPA